MGSSPIRKASIYFFAALLTFGLTRATMAQGSSGPKLSLDQKVGQIFIFGYPSHALTPASARLLSQIQPGGLIAFGRHIKSLQQIGQLNETLQRLSRETSSVPLLLMVDQEGGTVTRVRLSSPLPSALALGQLEDDSLIEKYGLQTGQLLKALGFEMNLAPVLDLSDPHSLTFIGNRSFGSNPQTVTRISLIYARGLAKAGIIPTAKHFPGHGGVSDDSHHSTPRKLASLSELESLDLKPFREFEQINFAKAVMAGHVALPNADPSNMPAAFSHYLLKDVLRQRIGFTGLAITDDVEMSGASLAGTLGERVIKAFEAGNDMIMVAGSPRAQWEAFRALRGAVQSGRISLERLDESVNRILKAKSRIKPFKFSNPVAQRSARELSSLAEKIAELNFDQSAQPFDELRGFYSSEQSYLLFSSDPRFYGAFQENIPKNTRMIRLTPDSLSDVNQALRKHPQAMVIYYASGMQTAKWLRSIPHTEKSRIIVINTNQPAAIENQSQFKAVFNLNTPAPQSGAWLAEFLSFKPLKEYSPQALSEPSATSL